MVFFSFCWGLDGSGDHSNYHQLTKTHFTTKQVMSVCFGIRDIKVVDCMGNSEGWSSSVGGHNRPLNVRPLADFPTKENKELLVEFIPGVEKEIDRIENDGIKLEVSTELVAKCEKASLSMIDGKMVTNLLQVDGAYCSMCTKSLPDSHNIQVIDEGFVIDRSLQSISDIALVLADTDNGEVVRKKGDYSARQ